MLVCQPETDRLIFVSWMQRLCVFTVDSYDVHIDMHCNALIDLKPCRFQEMYLKWALYKVMNLCDNALNVIYKWWLSSFYVLSNKMHTYTKEINIFTYICNASQICWEMCH